MKPLQKTLTFEDQCRSIFDFESQSMSESKFSVKVVNNKVSLFVSFLQVLFFVHKNIILGIKFDYKWFYFISWKSVEH